MLVLRRRAGESLLLGPDIEIEVIEISRSRVKLGVRAPRELSVVRREAASIALENQSAAGILAGRGIENIVRLLRNVNEEP
jgi:carbon storage regulator